ncbi:MAG: hypothetical protein J5486_03595 [Bacteroidaceae bacterium]|nr:hypothetical protein [Bacteroidaceae bacterium]
MFDLQGKIHDRYTLELKVGYGAASASADTNTMILDAWFFFPDALYLNSETYPKATVYRDVRSMVRIITPVFSLSELADPEQLPLRRLTKWCKLVVESQTARHCQMYEHQVKMFCNITRSAIRDADISAGKLLSQLSSVLTTYRQLPEQTGLDSLPSDLRTIFRLGDEYISRVACTKVITLLRNAQEQERDEINKWMERELEYERGQGYQLPREGMDKVNRMFLHRAGQLKKYVESDLYILVHEHNNTFYLQQLFFMLVAGLSMVFATIISFSFQQSFGNFTVELFVALTISYMFKDRIKGLGQQWFATKAGSKFFDYKTNLAFRGERIGWRKTGTSFVRHKDLPAEVKALRGRTSTLEAGNSAISESVLIYRQRLALYKHRLASLSHYPLSGVNEIIRINLREFLRRMDSSHTTVYDFQGADNVKSLQAEKVYYVHLIVRAVYDSKTSFHHLRLGLTRRGLIELKALPV